MPEHLVAIIAFAGAGQRRRLFRILDILTVKRATGDILEQCRFLINTQFMFPKKEKDSTTKIFDDDGWIRSLTEARAVTAEILEERITNGQSEVDPKKNPTHPDGEVPAKCVSRRLQALSEGEIAALTAAMRQLGVGSQKEELKPSPFSTNSWLTSGRPELSQDQSLTKHMVLYY